MDSSKQFVPFREGWRWVEWKEKREYIGWNSAFSDSNQKDVILLDAGLGQNDENGYFQLYRNIKNAGFEPMR